jgi:5-methylcytosine-specific restriction enzyme A
MTRPPSFRAAWGGSAGGQRTIWRQEAEAWAPRASPRQRGYDRDWQRLRARVLAAQPYCVPCARRGVETQAQMLDHVVSIRDAPERRLDPSNLMPMCWACHRAKTMRVDHGFGRPRGD